jgi:hypothetical protein
LVDCATVERITFKPTTCPNHNAGLVAVLKNLQTMLQIVFSDSYAKCFDTFIENLEGASQPMELVPSDLLKHSVELTSIKVFRIIRSGRSASLPGLDVESPESCSRFFTDNYDLSDHATMSKQNLFYRVKLSRNQETSSCLRAEVETQPRIEKTSVKPSVKFIEPRVEDKPAGATKVCSGHLGKQQVATRKDGRPYVCAYGKDCTLVHMSISGKSDQKLLEVAATIPSPMKQDITRAISSRK